MSQKTKIEWTESTWNPTTGCTKVSAGCTHCYAETMTRRFEKQWGKFNRIKLHSNRLEIPLKRKKPTLYFVNSMSDLFHHDIPDSFIQEVFFIMNATPHHTFQVLTKRADRIYELNNKLNWTPNIWMGVTIENAKYYNRMNPLLQCHAKIKFLSLEPLIGPVDKINLKGIDWVIVGGESGNQSRLIKKSWIMHIRDKAKHLNIPFFFKQWGGRSKKVSGCVLDGEQYKEIPILNIQYKD